MAGCVRSWLHAPHSLPNSSSDVKFVSVLSLLRLGHLLLPQSISVRQTPHAGAPTPSPMAEPPMVRVSGFGSALSLGHTMHHHLISFCSRTPAGFQQLNGTVGSHTAACSSQMARPVWCWSGPGCPSKSCWPGSASGMASTGQPWTSSCWAGTRYPGSPKLFLV